MSLRATSILDQMTTGSVAGTKARNLLVYLSKTRLFSLYQFVCGLTSPRHLISFRSISLCSLTTFFDAASRLDGRPPTNNALVRAGVCSFPSDPSFAPVVGIGLGPTPARPRPPHHFPQTRRSTFPPASAHSPSPTAASEVSSSSPTRSGASPSPSLTAGAPPLDVAPFLSLGLLGAPGGGGGDCPAVRSRLAASVPSSPHPTSPSSLASSPPATVAYSPLGRGER